MDACHDRWKGTVTYFATTYTLANYKQTGGGRLVRNLVHASGGDTAILRCDLAHGTNDAYDGLDRFGRVGHLKWTDNDATTHVELKYGHAKTFPTIHDRADLLPMDGVVRSGQTHCPPLPAFLVQSNHVEHVVRAVMIHHIGVPHFADLHGSVQEGFGRVCKRAHQPNDHGRE